MFARSEAALGVARWIEARAGFGGLARALAGTARGRAWWLGAAALVAFVVQIATGALLLVHYTPTPERAFASAQAILWDVPFGWLIRLVHAQGASALLAIGITHTVLAAVRADYKQPRELVWVCGRILALLGFAAALTGYILPWSQLSYWATTIATSPLEKIPFAGATLVALARGSETVSGATLSRAFVAHVIALPLVGIGLFALYGRLLARARRLEPGGRFASQPSSGLVRDRALEVAMIATVYLAIVLVLAIFVPHIAFPLHADRPADPLNTPNPIRPEWYFLWASELQRSIPEWIAILPLKHGPLATVAGWVGELLPLAVIASAPLALLSIPFVDRGPERDPRRRPIAMLVIVVTLAVLAALTVRGSHT